jgi:hypothetical protein
MAETDFFSAKRHEQTNDITRSSPLLKQQPHRSFSAQVTSQGFPSTRRGADTSARESVKSTAASLGMLPSLCVWICCVHARSTA